MANTSTVMFNDLTNPAIVINGPVSPQNIILLARTISDRTANHTKFVYQLTSTKLREWRLEFADLTLAMKDLLIDFFTDDVIGPTNTFTYTHTNGKEYTACRFKDDELTITRTEPGKFSVAVILELAHKIDNP